METIKLDISKSGVRLTEEMEARACEANALLYSRKGAGSDFLGWVGLPGSIPGEEIDRILTTARRLREQAEAVICIGIGGSYLGARAITEALGDPFACLRSDKRQTQLLFAGQNLSEDYLGALMEAVADRTLAAIVISKSGTTTEPAVAFRIVKEEIERRYGKKGAAERIVAVTDKSRGVLRTLAANEGYTTFVIPDDVGGRYSVLTPVGLLPLAVAGVDIRELLAGAREMERATSERTPFPENPSAVYAAVRNALYASGKKIEILGSYEPRLHYFAEWWKQLYGESEGKEEKGLFPASVDFTADLHSMGQYIQQGERMLMETVVRFAPAEQQMVVPFDEANGDGLNFLAGKTMDFINRQAMDGTLLAHVEGGVPNIILNLDENNARTMGQLIYFFEYACGLSGYLLGVNPFDQPGVEAYKKNMFALLGKPGYEEMGEELRKRLR